MQCGNEGESRVAARCFYMRSPVLFIHLFSLDGASLNTSSVVTTEMQSIFRVKGTVLVYASI